MSSPLPAHRFSLTTLTATSVLLLSACGSTDRGDGDVELRFTWWGTDHRHQQTQEIIDVFEEQNPGITVEPEFRPWDGYIDQLNTQMAGGDAPDIIQMEDQYLREYAQRGQLLAIDEVDFSGFDDGVEDLGRTEEGLFGVTIGIVSFAYIANPALFDEAGVEMPDDTRWTWEDFAALSAELRESLGEQRFGATGVGPAEAISRVWMRQNGQDLFDEDGNFEMTVEDAASYLQWVMELEEAADFPDAVWMAEQEGVALEEMPLATHEAGLGNAWATQVIAFSQAAESHLELLRLPSPTGDVGDNSEWIKASQFLSISSDTDHPEEAQMFVDFFINSEESVEIGGLERGLPANLELRENALQNATEAEAEAAEYTTDVEQDSNEMIPVPPVGASAMAEIVDRFTEEARFGRLSTEEAAEAMIAELEQAFG